MCAGTLLTKDQEGCQTFLDLAGYYRHIVPGYSITAALPSDLTLKGKPKQILWTSDCEAAFMALEMLLVCVPVLQILDPNKPYNLQTDKSSHSPESSRGRWGGAPIAYVC